MFGSQQALVITLSGLLIVFSVLVLLVAIIKLFGLLFDRKPKKTKPENIKNVIADKVSDVPENKEDRQVIQDDDEILAVISAAVYSYGQATQKNYAINSIKPVASGRNTRSAWANAGIAQNTRPF